MEKQKNEKAKNKPWNFHYLVLESGLIYKL